jgi:hypothetical protein
MADDVEEGIGEPGGEKEILLPLLTLEDLQQKLEPFLGANPMSSLSTLDLPELAEIHRVEKPWGDPTLAVLLPNKDPEKIIDLLNSLYLPPRLSAVWHTDTKDLEVIWTALPLADDQQEIEGRKFKFQMADVTYDCEFGAASERLVELARFTMPITNPSSTQFRNLPSFTRMAHRRAKNREQTELTARSFWVRNVQLDEANAIRLLECLNFYLTYYDSSSPRILIHDIHEPVKSMTRYREGKFPKKINGRAFDENLMSFWDATRQSNTMLRFIFCYRIIEYAASHYVDAITRAKLAKVVANPSIGENVAEAIAEILSAFDGARADDVPRFNSLIINAVDPQIVWREIENNKEIFCERVVFDGGFTLAPITSKEESKKVFANGGLLKFANAIRLIRNVLVHGRDQVLRRRSLQLLEI